MNKATIISGEASETESDEEIEPKIESLKLTTSVQGAVVAGEDTESENENDGSISSAVSALGLPEQQLTYENNDKYDSILHQKLRECNGKLHDDVENFCNNLVGLATKNLASIDQQLIKSQLSIQHAVTSLKTISSNSSAIKNKLQMILSAHFIPNLSEN